MLLKHPTQLMKTKPTPIYIVGCGHSGTSLLNKILSTHSQIWAVGGESELYIKNYSNRFRKAQIYSWNSEAMNAKKSFVLEKTPRHVHKIPEIQQLQPESSFLGITRNPLDTVASLMERGASIDAAIQRYINDNSALQRLSQSMKIIQLENLIDDFEQILVDIQMHLKLKKEDLTQYHLVKTYYDSEIIRQPKGHSGTEHGIKRNYQVNQPIFDSRGKWKAVLNEKEREIILRATGNISNELGYSNALQQP